MLLDVSSSDISSVVVEMVIEDVGLEQSSLAAARISTSKDGSWIMRSHEFIHSNVLMRYV